MYIFNGSNADEQVIKDERKKINNIHLEGIKDINFYVFYIYSDNHVQVKEHKHSDKHNLCCIFLSDIY